LKLSQWAKKQGIHYNTAYRWFRNGTLPVKSYKTKSNTILVEEDVEAEEAKTVEEIFTSITLFCLKTFGIQRGMVKSQRIKEVIDDKND
jgi:predicted site-specific integrase-resolvase